MSKQFNDLLRSTLNEIEKKIESNYKKVVRDEAAKIRNASDYAKLIKKQEKLEADLEATNLAIKEADGEIETSTYRNYNQKPLSAEELTQVEAYKRLRDKGLAINHSEDDSSVYKSTLKAMQNCQSTPEALTYLEWKDMRKQYQEAY